MDSSVRDGIFLHCRRSLSFIVAFTSRFKRNAAPADLPVWSHSVAHPGWRHPSPSQYCSSHRRVSLGNNWARVDAFRWSPVHAVAASPGTESARHTFLGCTLLSRRQPLDPDHARFGSLEEGANLEDFTGGRGG